MSFQLKVDFDCARVNVSIDWSEYVPVTVEYKPHVNAVPFPSTVTYEMFGQGRVVYKILAHHAYSRNCRFLEQSTLMMCEYSIYDALDRKFQMSLRRGMGLHL